MAHSGGGGNEVILDPRIPIFCMSARFPYFLNLSPSVEAIFVHSNNEDKYATPVELVYNPFLGNCVNAFGFRKEEKIFKFMFFQFKVLFSFWMKQN